MRVVNGRVTHKRLLMLSRSLLNVTALKTQLMDASGLDLRFWRGRVLFSLLFFLIYRGVWMLTAFIHEVFGHGLFTVLLGGVFSAFYVTPHGMSFAYLGWRYGMKVTPFMNTLIWSGGLIAETLMGVIVLLVYPRLRGFIARFIALTLIYQGLFYSAFYLGGGSLAEMIGVAPMGNDPGGIQFHSGIPYSVLFIIALVGGALVMYVFVVKLAELLQDYYMFRGKRDLSVSIVAMFVVNWAGSSLISAVMGEASIMVALNLVGVMAILLPVGALATRRFRFPSRTTRNQLRVPVRFFAVIGILTVLTSAVWLGVFGYTSTQAHGILLEEYPAYCNMTLDLFDDQSVVVDLSFRPPLDRLWLSIKGSENWVFNVEVARMMAEQMFNVSQYEIVIMETTDDDFWNGRMWASGGARRIGLRVELSGSPSWQRIEESFRLTITDPWKHELSFVEMVNITSQDYSIQDYEYMPDSAMNVTSGGIREGYLLWLNYNFDDSPDVYAVTFR